MDVNFRTVSKSIKEDKEIIKYCQENIIDKRCSCVIPSEKIKFLQINSYTPYYCFLSECLDDKNFKTTLISEYQKKCNIVLCNVSIDDIKIDSNSRIIIENNCISSTSINNNLISEELLTGSLLSQYDPPNIFIKTFFPLIMGSLLLLL